MSNLFVSAAEMQFSCQNSLLLVGLTSSDLLIKAASQVEKNYQQMKTIIQIGLSK